MRRSLPFDEVEEYPGGKVCRLCGARKYKVSGWHTTNRVMGPGSRAGKEIESISCDGCGAAIVDLAKWSVPVGQFTGDGQKIDYDTTS